MGMPRKRDMAKGAAVAAIGAGALLMEYKHHKHHKHQLAESDDEDEAHERDDRRPRARHLHSADDMSRSRYRDNYRSALPDPMEEEEDSEEENIHYESPHPQPRVSQGYPGHLSRSLTYPAYDYQPASPPSTPGLEDHWPQQAYSHETRMMPYHPASPNHPFAYENRMVGSRSSSSAASSVSEENTSPWTWDTSKKTYYYDTVDKRTRVWYDGSKENLMPPRPPKPSERRWDADRRQEYWRNEEEKCWVFEGGDKIPFS